MKKYILIIAILLAFSLNAYAKDDVRIGLTSIYEEVDLIKINNKSLNLGYYEDGNFTELLKVKTTGDGFMARLNNIDLYISDRPVSEIGEYAAAIILKDGQIYYVSSEDKSDENISFSYLDSSSVVALDYYEGSVFMDNSGKNACFSTDDLRDNNPLVYVGQRAYRGYIEIAVLGDKLTAVNVVDMDEYLYSVVCSEVYADWHENSLKAQAVAARTYAKYNSGEKTKYKGKPYELSDDQRSQVYKGYNIEDERVRKAVDETSGEMIYYKDELINAFFFSTSGGSTANSEDIWTYEVPYLRAVPDIYETEPERKPWVNEMAKSTIKNKLESWDIYIGDIVSADVKEVNDIGIVMELQINGTSGSTVVKKEKIRALGLYSRKFKVLNEEQEPNKSVSVLSADNVYADASLDDAYVLRGTEIDRLSVDEQAMMIRSTNIENVPFVRGKSGCITFVGMGWGHNIGMSQAGAMCMAEAGFDYKDILKHYYTGVEVR